jgi:hypothetical protein
VDELSEVLDSIADQLESGMKEQKQLIVALKSFLEDEPPDLNLHHNPGNKAWKETKRNLLGLPQRCPQHILPHYCFLVSCQASL